MAKRTVAELAELLRAKDTIIRRDPIKDGKQGEVYAKQWLTARKAEWIDIEQRPEDLNEELKAAGGKRPDFIAQLSDDFFILLDAKFVDTDNRTAFKQTVVDLEKYRRGQEWLFRRFNSEWPNFRVETWFMVFPKECSGKRVVFVELSEMLKSSQEGVLGKKPARVLDIQGRKEWWDDNP